MKLDYSGVENEKRIRLLPPPPHSPPFSLSLTLHIVYILLYILYIRIHMYIMYIHGYCTNTEKPISSLYLILILHARCFSLSSTHWLIKDSWISSRRVPKHVTRERTNRETSLSPHAFSRAMIARVQHDIMSFIFVLPFLLILLRDSPGSLFFFLF